MGDEQKEIVRIESLLDRYLAAPPVQGPREPLHHPRRRRARGRSRHLLPHARVGRHDDLERLQALRRRSSTSDYPADEWNIYPFHFSDGDNWSMDDTLTCVEHPEDAAPAAREHVRLRPGREPLRLGPVHQGSARALRARTSASSRARSATRTRSSAASRTSSGRGSDVTAVRPEDGAARATCAPSRRRSRRSRASYGLDFFPIIFEMLTLRPDERDRGVRRLPEPLPALALRHGVRAARARATSTASRRSTRWSSTTTRRTPTCSRATRSTDQKLVMAHVLGHVDFFKNNFCFRSTDLDAGGPHHRSRAQRPKDYDPESPLDRQDGEPRLARRARTSSATASTRSRSSSTSASRSRT